MKSPRLVCCMLLFLSCASAAQNTPLGTGHWEGVVVIPGHDSRIPAHEIRMILDLWQDAAGSWLGNMAFPDQRTSAMKLTEISAKEASLSFRSPMTPSFQATVSENNEAMSGTIQMARSLRSVQLKRTASPNRHAGSGSTLISASLEGTWEGTLTYRNTWGEMTPPEGDTPDGAKFDLRVRFGNRSMGVGMGTITRMDEPGAELPLDLVIQNGELVRFEIYSVAGTFEGQLRGDCIVGEWRQLGTGSLPLSFRRAAN